MAYVYQIAAASFGDMVSERAKSCHISTARMSYAFSCGLHGLQRSANVFYESKHYYRQHYLRAPF